MSNQLALLQSQRGSIMEGQRGSVLEGQRGTARAGQRGSVIRPEAKERLAAVAKVQSGLGLLAESGFQGISMGGARYIAGTLVVPGAQEIVDLRRIPHGVVLTFSNSPEAPCRGQIPNASLQWHQDRVVVLYDGQILEALLYFWAAAVRDWRDARISDEIAVLRAHFQQWLEQQTKGAIAWESAVHDTSTVLKEEWQVELERQWQTLRAQFPPSGVSPTAWGFVRLHKQPSDSGHPEMPPVCFGTAEDLKLGTGPPQMMEERTRLLKVEERLQRVEAQGCEAISFLRASAGQGLEEFAPDEDAGDPWVCEAWETVPPKDVVLKQSQLLNFCTSQPYSWALASWVFCLWVLPVVPHPNFMFALCYGVVGVLGGAILVWWALHGILRGGGEGLARFAAWTAVLFVAPFSVPSTECFMTAWREGHWALAVLSAILLLAALGFAKPKNIVGKTEMTVYAKDATMLVVVALTLHYPRLLRDDDPYALDTTLPYRPKPRMQPASFPTDLPDPDPYRTGPSYVPVPSPSFQPIYKPRNDEPVALPPEPPELEGQPAPESGWPPFIAAPPSYKVLKPKVDKPMQMPDLSALKTSTNIKDEKITQAPAPETDESPPLLRALHRAAVWHRRRRRCMRVIVQILLALIIVGCLAVAWWFLEAPTLNYFFHDSTLPTEWRQESINIQDCPHHSIPEYHSGLWRCACVQGFRGTVLWSGTRFFRKCHEVLCPDLANRISLDKPRTGYDCSCMEGTVGHVAWDDDSREFVGWCKLQCPEGTKIGRDGLSCDCNSGFYGGLKVTENGIEGGCKPRECPEYSTLSVTGDCVCNEGFVGRLRFDKKVNRVVGKCTSALCPDHAVGGGESGACECVDGFTGDIFFDKGLRRFRGECLAMPCPEHSDGMGAGKPCRCLDGFEGNVAWLKNESKYQSNCHRAPCPAHSSVMGNLCACDTGFFGGLVWGQSAMGKPQYSGQCIPIPCPEYGIGEGKGTPCHCMPGYFPYGIEKGSLVLSFSVDDGRYIGSCEPIHCPSPSLGSGGGSPCNCPEGFDGGPLEFDKRIGAYTGQCTLVPCPSQSEGDGGGQPCMCLETFEGEISWSRSENRYLGTCVGVSCPTHAMKGPDEVSCLCERGYTGSIKYISKKYVGSCTAVPCPAGAIGPGGGTHCACSAGHQGNVFFDSGANKYLGKCMRITCPEGAIWSEDRGGGCVCTGNLNGQLQWDNVTLRYTGKCAQSDCPLNAEESGQLVKYGDHWAQECACRIGFQGNITWANGIGYQGACSPVPCPKHSKGFGGGMDCVCSVGFAGSPYFDLYEGRYIGECRPLCPENSIQDATSGPHRNCVCIEGYKGDLVWDDVRSAFTGKCSPIPCPEGSIGAGIGGICECFGREVGNITWESALNKYLGGCKLATCPPNARHDGEECLCKERFNGKVIWSPVHLAYLGNCEPIPCPKRAKRTVAGDTCRCVSGYQTDQGRQFLDWRFDHYGPSCSRVPCPTNTVGVGGGQLCQCESGFIGGFAWHRVGNRYKGSCVPVPCPVASSGMGGGGSCNCDQGFAGSLRWNGSAYTGHCWEVRCPQHSERIDSGDCVCTEPYEGVISFNPTATTYEGECKLKGPIKAPPPICPEPFRFYCPTWLAALGCTIAFWHSQRKPPGELHRVHDALTKRAWNLFGLALIVGGISLLARLCPVEQHEFEEKVLISESGTSRTCPAYHRATWPFGLIAGLVGALLAVFSSQALVAFAYAAEDRPTETAAAGSLAVLVVLGPLMLWTSGSDPFSAIIVVVGLVFLASLGQRVGGQDRLEGQSWQLALGFAGCFSGTVAFLALLAPEGGARDAGVFTASFVLVILFRPWTLHRIIAYGRSLPPHDAFRSDVPKVRLGAALSSVKEPPKTEEEFSGSLRGAREQQPTGYALLMEASRERNLQSNEGYLPVSEMSEPGYESLE